MSDESADIYRRRIYDSYVTMRDRPLAPEALAGLKPRMPYFRRMISRYFPADERSEVLELGCGHGALLYALREAGYSNVRGVDGSSEQVAAAQALGIPGVCQGDVMRFLRAIPSNSLDVVVAFDLIEHFRKCEVIALVDEVHRVLRRGGRWIIHAPNAEAPFGARMRHWDFTHEVAYTRISLAQVMRASGFSEVMCFEDRPVPHGFKSGARAALWMLLRGILLFYVAVETGSADRKAIFSQNLLAVVRK